VGTCICMLLGQLHASAAPSCWTSGMVWGLCQEGYELLLINNSNSPFFLYVVHGSHWSSSVAGPAGAQLLEDAGLLMGLCK
jgi:hypothetical protein